MMTLLLALALQTAPEIDEATQAKIDKGLDWLASQQGRDGGLRGSSAVTCATSLAGLAWLARGDTGERGRYSDNITAALRFVAKATDSAGYVNASGDGSSIMHGHGYGVLFLAQATGTITDPELRDEVYEALTRAVRLIEKSQNQWGGWNSSPNRSAGDDGSGAIAVMQVMGLRAAREVGIAVDQQCIDKAQKYLKEMMNASGWYQYNYHSRTGNRQSSALTGAGLYMLGAFDLWDDPKYEKGVKNLMSAAPFLKGSARGGDGGWSSWYVYTAFYASIGIFQHGGEEWKTWWPAMSADLLKQQSGNGSWPDGYGGVYTALALLTLELPYRTLPVFQTGGHGREGD